MTECDEKLKPCPICGASVRITEIKHSTVYNGNRQDVYAKIECECGLSFEREWTRYRAEDGYIKSNATITDVWNMRAAEHINKVLRLEKDAIVAGTLQKVQDQLEQRIHDKLAYHGWYLKETVIPFAIKNAKL